MRSSLLGFYLARAFNLLVSDFDTIHQSRLGKIGPNLLLPIDGWRPRMNLSRIPLHSLLAMSA